MSGMRDELRRFREGQSRPTWDAGSSTHILPFEFAADDLDGPVVVELPADGPPRAAGYLLVQGGQVREVHGDG